MDAQEAVAALEAAGLESAPLKGRIDAMQAAVKATELRIYTLELEANEIELRIEAMERTNAAVRGFVDSRPPAIATA